MSLESQYSSVSVSVYIIRNFLYRCTIFFSNFFLFHFWVLGFFPVIFVLDFWVFGFVFGFGFFYSNFGLFFNLPLLGFRVFFCYWVFGFVSLLGFWVFFSLYFCSSVIDFLFLFFRY